MTARIPKELDATVDTVLAYRPSKEQPETEGRPWPVPDAWSVSSEQIFSDDGLRLDAAHFDPGASLDFNYDSTALSEWAEVRFIRDRGQKVFSAEPVSGTKPYLNATEFQAILSFAKEPERFISKVSDVDFDAFLIQAGWLLVTRSGTLGRVFYVTKRFSGWFASDDLIRVIPNRAETAGYLYAWLSTPAAQKQILREGYGGQIDHIDDTHLRKVRVPCLDDDVVERISTKVVRSMKLRDAALRRIGSAWDDR